MRAGGWLLAGAACAFACAPKDTGAASSASVQHVLFIHVSGSGAGTVTSSTGFTCSAQCRQSIDASSSLRLTASPAQGSVFKGWQGACSGSGSCALSMAADQDVSALFDVEQAPNTTARVSVALTGHGTGRVVSTPPAIDCPAVTCSAVVQKGATLALSAEPDPASTFAGWQGVCNGAGACSINATGDETVLAQFESATPPPPPSPPPPPPQCAGLSPAAPATPAAITTFTPGSCWAGMADEKGTLGLQSFGPGRVALHIVDPDMARERAVAEQRVDHGGFLAMPDGFTGVLWQPGASGQFSANHWDGSGKYLSASQTLQGRPAYIASPTAGAVLLAGDFSWSGWPTRHQAFALAQNGGFLWAADLASKGMVDGLGFDKDRNALVITDGGDRHSITAQWFSSIGAALTGEFVLVADFTPGANTWFETAPLIGGGVAVRRVDQLDDADGRAYRTAQWLLVASSGLTSTQPAPQWLTSRPNTNLVLARQGAAYAVLPLGAPGADCAQKIEVLAPDGTSCGWFDASIARGQCRTEDMGLGRDGTPIQLMPKALAPANTCSYRWWPAALR